MQRLLALGFPGQPAAELLPATVKIWEGLIAPRLEDEENWLETLNNSFDTLESTLDRWPLPADILECLPKKRTYAASYHRPLINYDGKKRTNELSHIKDTLGKLDFGGQRETDE
jgi:hypothetical protein